MRYLAFFREGVVAMALANAAMPYRRSMAEWDGRKMAAFAFCPVIGNDVPRHGNRGSAD